MIFGYANAQNERSVMSTLDLLPYENGLLVDDMQKVLSAYKKDDSPVIFIRSSIFLHLYKKRTIPFLRSVGFQISAILLRNGSVVSIDDSGRKVNIRGLQFSNIIDLIALMLRIIKKSGRL